MESKVQNTNTTCGEDGSSNRCDWGHCCKHTKLFLEAVAIAALPDLITLCKMARKRLLKARDPQPEEQRIAGLIEDVLRKAGIEEETWENAYAAP